MHDDGTLITIGELARRTGLTVRTLRFYADSGLVVPAARSDAGYRLYDDAAAARAELVRTLRELGLGVAARGAARTSRARASMTPASLRHRVQDRRRGRLGDRARGDLHEVA
jgi:DNA-binding transcriptional MerR regulator